MRLQGQGGTVIMIWKKFNKCMQNSGRINKHCDKLVDKNEHWLGKYTFSISDYTFFIKRRVQSAWEFQLY